MPELLSDAPTHLDNHEALGDQIQRNCGWECPFLLADPNSFQPPNS